tara:strand:- start:756 stop:917 length:162 start_codon:yes stop_codon:yes gene_type:complete
LTAAAEEDALSKGRPTGFGSRIDAKGAVKGDMPSGFEEKPKVEEQVNFHTEML